MEWAWGEGLVDVGVQGTTVELQRKPVWVLRDPKRRAKTEDTYVIR